MRRRVRITQKQFDAALKDYKSQQPELLHQREETIEIARLVLVLGKPQADVARDNGLSRQWVSDIVNRFIRLLPEDIPSGWTSETVTLPAEEWPRVREIEARARAHYARSQSSPAPAAKSITSKARRRKQPPS
jgi:hypothetical protein